MNNDPSNPSLTWEAPPLWTLRGELIGYKLQYSRQISDADHCTMLQSSFSSIELAADTMHFPLSNFLRGSKYVFSVAAQTSIGAGLFSQCLMFSTGEKGSSSSDTSVGVGVGVAVGLVLLFILAIIIVVAVRARRQAQMRASRAKIFSLAPEEEHEGPGLLMCTIKHIIMTFRSSSNVLRFT